jgi:hypothetical protein
MTDKYESEVKDLINKITKVVNNKNLYDGIAALTVVLNEALSLIDDSNLRDKLINEIIKQINEERGSAKTGWKNE